MDCYNAVVRNNLNGLPCSNVPFVVYESDGITLATIYAPDGVTEITNPMQSDPSGNVSVFAANGTYFGGVVSQAERKKFILYDPALDPDRGGGNAKTDTIAINMGVNAGRGPYPLTDAPIAGKQTSLQVGPLYYNSTNYSVNGNQLTINAGVDVADYATFDFSYYH